MEAKDRINLEASWAKEYLYNLEQREGVYKKTSEANQAKQPVKVCGHLRPVEEAVLESEKTLETIAALREFSQVKKRAKKWTDRPIISVANGESVV